MNNLEYCAWAYNAVDAYYGKLLKMQEDYPLKISLRLLRGQIDWALEERDIWKTKIEEYQ